MPLLKPFMPHTHTVPGSRLGPDLPRVTETPASPPVSRRLPSGRSNLIARLGKHDCARRYGVLAHAPETPAAVDLYVYGDIWLSI